MPEIADNIVDPALGQFAQLCGAIIDPNEAAVFKDSLAIKAYSDLPRTPGRGKKRFLWDYVRQVFGTDFAELQTKGTCVSKAVQRACMILWCVRIALNNMAEKLPGTPASEAIFALGRVEIGGGKLGNRDGCVVGWALDAVMKYGVLLRNTYTDPSGKTVDLTKPNDNIAEMWGLPHAGLPNFLEPIAEQLPVKDAAPVSSLDDVMNSLYNGDPVFGGSNQVPDPNAPRDSHGYIRLPLRGGHSTLFTGYDDTVSPGWVFYDNASWYPVDGPNPDNFPVYGGKVPYSTVTTMLHQGEWYALSDITGMPDQSGLFDQI